MKNIIPFKKDIIFKTNVSEIISISLENTLNIQNDLLTGEFVLSGEYKISDNSTTTEPFNFNIPFEIVIDERYDSSQAIVDIDDFYYEIKNDNILSVSIDVLLDKLKEKPLLKLEDLAEDKERNNEIMNKEELFLKEEDKKTTEEVVENNIAIENINILNQINCENEVYVTYSVAIIREGDSIDSIISKYNVSIEELKKYNDINNLKIGDKIVIPFINESN